MGDCDDRDFIRPIGALPDGRTVVQRHQRDHTTMVGTLRPARDGAAMGPGEEMVVTRQRADGSHDVIDSYAYGAPVRGKPAQVATRAYRDSWDRTFNAPGGSA
jgi:hypothetical protein